MTFSVNVFFFFRDNFVFFFFFFANKSLYLVQKTICTDYILQYDLNKLKLNYKNQKSFYYSRLNFSLTLTFSRPLNI